MPSYRLSREASRDIVELFAVGLRTFGIAQAEAYYDGLFSAFDFLAAYPRSAPLRSELRRPVRVYAYRSHLIVYALDADDDMRILRVRQGRESWTENPARTKTRSEPEDL